MNMECRWGGFLGKWSFGRRTRMWSIENKMNHREAGLCREVVKWFKVVTNDES
jgi:hypothetical protein